MAATSFGPVPGAALADSATGTAHRHHAPAGKKHAASGAAEQAPGQTQTPAPVRTQGRARRRGGAGSMRARSDENVAVTGHRFVSHNADTVVARAFMEQQVPGTNILRSLQMVPGVNYSSTDALGIDTWGANLYVRGFFMDQLGVTLDGIPLNDQSYSNLNGVNVADAAIPDDIARESVSQGAGAVQLPSNTNLGGTLQFWTRDPTDKMGGKITQGFGSYKMEHSYFRFDSGILNPSGTKFFVAYDRNYEEKYSSPSPDFQQGVDAKLIQPLGQRGTMTAFFNWSNAQAWNYPDLSLDILQNVGWRTRAFYPNYAGAYAAAQWNWICDTGSSPAASCTGGAGTINPTTGQPFALRGPNQVPNGWQNTAEGAGVAYYDGGQQSIDYVGGLNFDITLNERLRWLSTLYGHSDTQYTTYGDPFMGSTTGAPLSEQVWQPRQERYGFTTALDYTLARHHINAGFWYENNNQAEAQYWYNEPVLGQGLPLETIGPYDTYGPAFAQAYGFQWSTNTFQAHVMDTWRLMPTLTLEYGFKSLLQTTSGGAYYGNADVYGTADLPNGSMTSANGFLPHVNLDWHPRPQHDLYVDIAENMRPFTVAPTGGATSPWAVTGQSIFKGLQHSLSPERDWTFLLGYRYTSPYLIVATDGYYTYISHRLLSASVGSLNNPLTSVVDTRVATMYGADISATLTPVRGLTIYNSFSYNHFTWGAHTEIQDGNGNYDDIYGNVMDGYPKFMYKAMASYTFHGFTAHIDANYLSKRYFSILNDTWIPSYWLVNGGVRYQFGNFRFFKNVTADFNIYNLNNTKYIAMMGENGFPVTGDYQSFERGSVRELFGTISTEF
ncbi:TonB-dependent receptor domain-containing protein [Nguyenibacter sp. L1]|uniref:TonB-dependent receptor n=1 Tax=Nguyenibacter sp. L1 TaxID=3049350 RepID=UPI002B47A584|nr:TonB-dependent receptor [Nguyenibacter sp. L1]WRH89522.1 TonB-dependent receptor [Nguyenibacter sp. L1]